MISSKKREKGPCPKSRYKPEDPISLGTLSNHCRGPYDESQSKAIHIRCWDKGHDGDCSYDFTQILHFRIGIPRTPHHQHSRDEHLYQCQFFPIKKYLEKLKTDKLKKIYELIFELYNI